MDHYFIEGGGGGGAWTISPKKSLHSKNGERE